MARIRTGRPNGRPPLEVKGEMIDLHIKAPAAIVQKIDRLRQRAETRKDVIIRVLREYSEEN
jgi:hypothetical protein